MTVRMVREWARAKKNVTRIKKEREKTALRSISRKKNAQIERSAWMHSVRHTTNTPTTSFTSVEPMNAVFNVALPVLNAAGYAASTLIRNEIKLWTIIYDRAIKRESVKRHMFRFNFYCHSLSVAGFAWMLRDGLLLHTIAFITAITSARACITHANVMLLACWHVTRFFIYMRV